MRKRSESLAPGEHRVIPVAQEELKVEKRQRITGTTRVKKVVREIVTIADEPLRTEEVRVERVPINEYIDIPRRIREESDATVIPVMEEVLVVEKKLLLKEEVRIRRVSGTVHRPQTVVLRKEEAIVERTKPEEEQERPSGEAAGKGGKQ